MFTMILLVYLQMGRTVNLAGATVVGEFSTLALCQQAAVRRKGALPIPRGYAAAWQDTMCVAIDRDVQVGNERLTAFEKLLADALEPRACDSEGACRRAGIAPVPPDQPQR
ncbi:MAG: hypothetical protein JWQ01_2445 [Massilia sp.]|jgi:hypothetical protein|nr:hypothetical protein [Massilia sp.]